jgi:hypothetical protein
VMRDAAKRGDGLFKLRVEVTSDGGERGNTAVTFAATATLCAPSEPQN